MAPLPRWAPAFPAEPGSDSIERASAPSRSVVAEVPLLVATALVIAFLVKTFVAQAFFIPSGSMLPTLEDGDRVVVSRLAYRIHEPRRGDVVVFEAPSNLPDENGDDPLPVRAFRGFFETVGVMHPSAEDFIKRVVGLPGEEIEGRDGRIWIDGRPLDEPYLIEGIDVGTFAPETVPDGHVFVMGDNRENSRDSRYFGPVPMEKIVGRAALKIWPPARVGFL